MPYKWYCSNQKRSRRVTYLLDHGLIERKTGKHYILTKKGRAIKACLEVQHESANDAQQEADAIYLHT